MSESEYKQIIVLDAATASYRPMTIATGTFDMPAHEGAITISIQVFAKNDPYSRYQYIRINNEQVLKKIVNGSSSYSKTMELPVGSNTIEVEISSWVGHWEVHVQVNYIPVPEIVIDTEIPVLPIIGIFIAIIGGLSYVLTNGFTTPPKLPMLSSPF